MKQSDATSGHTVRRGPARRLSASDRAAFEVLDAKLAPGGEYAVKAAQREKDREARDAAITRLITKGA
ncbi:MAG: hypothetical protein NVV70_14390 [Cellulomonas sp.]|nr:hypothetical protein [Cellulomonas sp.]MCR6649262.1 hypothetical protein [Cellulomonas sp.]